MTACAPSSLAASDTEARHPGRTVTSVDSKSFKSKSEQCDVQVECRRGLGNLHWCRQQAVDLIDLELDGHGQTVVGGHERPSSRSKSTSHCTEGCCSSASKTEYLLLVSTGMAIGRICGTASLSKREYVQKTQTAHGNAPKNVRPNTNRRTQRKRFTCAWSLSASFLQSICWPAHNVLASCSPVHNVLASFWQSICLSFRTNVGSAGRRCRKVGFLVVHVRANLAFSVRASPETPGYSG